MNLTRTTVHRTHALISPDGYVNSVWPGWKNCTVNVIISPAMGANFCQNRILTAQGCELSGTTKTSEIFFYVVSGNGTALVDKDKRSFDAGHFIFIPAGFQYVLDGFSEGTQLLTFHKSYEPLTGISAPKPLFGDASAIKGLPFMGDPALQLQTLLSEDLSFDMAVNIFTFQPGGQLPFVETHVMEHGLLFLQGEGSYRLDGNRYAVTKGDCIWMAPFCAQWFEAKGIEPAVYIYYKNVNRQAIPD